MDSRISTIMSAVIACILASSFSVMNMLYMNPYMAVSAKVWMFLSYLGLYYVPTFLLCLGAVEVARFVWTDG